jgi:DUF4097 and DUF4098 domain-containing protein YvlB
VSAVRRTETFPTGHAHCTVSVSMASGQIEVRAIDALHVSVDLDADHADDWDVSQFGDSVVVRAPRRRRTRSAKVGLQVPIGTDIRIEAASADVVMHGTVGDVRVRTASGDLRADEVARLDFGSASGDVQVHTVTGRLMASTASGDVRATRVGDDCQCGTASGDVRIECCDGDSIDVKTVSGDIQLGLPAGIRVDPDIHTLSGRTRLPAPRTSPAPADAPRRNVRLRLRAVSGDVTVERIDR